MVFYYHVVKASNSIVEFCNRKAEACNTKLLKHPFSNRHALQFVYYSNVGLTPQYANIDFIFLIDIDVSRGKRYAVLSSAPNQFYSGQCPLIGTTVLFLPFGFVNKFWPNFAHFLNTSVGLSRLMTISLMSSPPAMTYDMLCYESGTHSRNGAVRPTF